MAPDLTSQAASAASAGIAAMVVAAVGVHPQVIGYALMGAAVGTLWAPSVGRLRAVALFVAVVMLAALLGTWAAGKWHAGDRMTADVIAGAVAILAHPLLTAVVTHIPGLGHWLAGRVTGGKT